MSSYELRSQSIGKELRCDGTKTWLFGVQAKSLPNYLNPLVEIGYMSA
jgi:hypothetical protein